MKLSFRATLISVLFASAPAFGAEARIPQEHDLLVANGNLALRASSPDPTFQNKGERIGWLKEGDAVRVKSAKQISTVYGFEVWLEVQAQGATGWVYDGLNTEVLHGRAKLSESKAVVAVLVQRI